MNKIWLVYALFLLPYLCGVLYVACQELKDVSASNFVLFDSLNVSMSGPNNERVISGADEKANISFWDNSFVDREKRDTLRAEHKLYKFNIDEISRFLDHKAMYSGGKNLALAALTVVFRIIEQSNTYNYYCTTILLERAVLEEPSPKNFKKDKSAQNEVAKERYCFKSGKDNAGNNDLSELYAEACNRKNAGVFSSELNDMFRKILVLQAAKVKKTSDIFSQSAHVLVLGNQLENYNENILSQFNERELVELEKQLASSQEITLRAEDRRTTELSYFNGFGPIFDSEQHVLHCLKHKFTPNEKDENLMTTVLKNFQDGQRDYLTKKFGMPYLHTVNELRENFNKAIAFRENVETGFAPVGCFLHLYSTNDVCEFCARSLLYEFYFAEDNFVTQVKKYLKDTYWAQADYTPFFAILVSYKDYLGTDSGKALRPRGTISKALRPRGTISSKDPELHRLPSDEKFSEGVIDLNEIIVQKILPIVHMKRPKDSANKLRIVRAGQFYKILPEDYH